jgi:hypothetical protein
LCGLFGVISDKPLSVPERENVQMLGMMSSLRGIDSTGLMTAYTRKNKTKYHLNRAVGNPVNFLTDPRICGIVNTTTPFLMMGHARAATVGTINEHNAHPIKEGPIIGCHNGTIWKYGPTKAEEDTSSDSRVLFRKIADHGLQDTLNDAGDLAAYALSWLNLNSMTFNLIRNDKRPLFVMWNVANTTMYWASERGMLCWLAERTNLAYHSPEVVPEKTHIRFRLGNMVPLIQKLEVVPKPVAHYQGWNTAAWDYCENCWHKKPDCACEVVPSKALVLLEEVKDATLRAFGLKETDISVDGEIIEPQRVYLGFNRAVWTMAELEKKLKDGCCNCLRDLEPTDKIFWFSRSDPVCEDCVGFVLLVTNITDTVNEGKFLN